MVGVESGIYAQHRGQASNHQPRADQQDKGERNLGDNEHALSTMSTTRTRSSFPERPLLIETSGLEGWHQSEENSGQDRGDHSERQHPQVHSDLLSTRQQQLWK